MKIIKTIGQKSKSEYLIRPTVKAIVVNKDDKVAIFSGLLLGGGIDEGESSEQALHRECMEEAGILIEIQKPLGIVVQYRNEIEKKYEIAGFLALLIDDQALPTTNQQDELGKTLEWHTIDAARNIFERRVADLQSPENSILDKETTEGRLFNTITALVFLNEASKDLSKK